MMMILESMKVFTKQFRVFGNISSPKLKEENVNVNWNTHRGVLRDFATLVSTIVRICDYEMVQGGNISMACNGIILEKVKCHVKVNWYKFYQNESQKAFANICNWIRIRNKFKVIEVNLTAFFRLHMCISTVKINISNGRWHCELTIIYDHQAIEIEH